MLITPSHGSGQTAPAAAVSTRPAADGSDPAASATPVLWGPAVVATTSTFWSNWWEWVTESPPDSPLASPRAPAAPGPLLLRDEEAMGVYLSRPATDKVPQDSAVLGQTQLIEAFPACGRSPSSYLLRACSESGQHLRLCRPTDFAAVACLLHVPGIVTLMPP